ncbi:MerR family transcriptional regulator [Agrococcus sp. Marseille-P2731]|uniref:MerR family transcriptional regulator n=1 Tax=Agrococcus sp. Marseille-P2731 TaxID=1841862 RepID=UPI0009311DFC|nr:MerR family transcriptional regulator [Agrococcus sp. Marseille-P2731]
MAWSTRELADLTGTTVNTVRHYHRLGLLELPERSVNGYKHYGVQHVVRLLRIRRLVDLGVPLMQIAELSSDVERTPEALLAVDAQLAEQIERLQRARDDIAAILAGNGPADAPRGFEAISAQLSDADSSMLHLYSQLYDEDVVRDLRAMVEAEAGDAAEAEFNALTADADDATRQRVAEALAPALEQHMRDFPWVLDPVSRSQRDAQSTAETFVEAVVQLYNAAQLDALGRADVIARARVQQGDGEAGGGAGEAGEVGEAAAPGAGDAPDATPS